MIHQIHKGDELSLTGYNYGGVLYNEVTYPQDVRKCTTCHAGTQGGRHLTNPSRKACGSCHDNIAWALTPIPTKYSRVSNSISAEFRATMAHVRSVYSNSNRKCPRSHR